MNQQEEIEEVTSRINKLNGVQVHAGTPKYKTLGRGLSGAGSGGVGIWKKLKRKTKKKRNLTDPEITTQQLRDAIFSNGKNGGNASLVPLKENVDEREKGKEYSPKEKSSANTKDLKRKSKLTEQEIVLTDDLDSLAVNTGDTDEDTSLGQKSDTWLSQSDTWHDVNEEVITPTISPKPMDRLALKGFSLNPSLSHSTPFISSAEHFHTLSSPDIPDCSSSLTVEVEPLHSQENENSPPWDNGGSAEQEKEVGQTEYSPFLQGSSTLYKNFGSKDHKLNLNKVHEFLESCGEVEPVDLGVLQEWDGWIIAARDIM